MALLSKRKDDRLLQLAASILSGLISSNEVSTRREGEVESAIAKAKEIAQKLIDS